MRYSSHGPFHQPISFLLRQFLQGRDLPLSNVLSEGTVSQALTAISVCCLDRIYSPVVTLWVFLSQVANSARSTKPLRKRADHEVVTPHVGSITPRLP